MKSKEIVSKKQKAELLEKNKGGLLSVHAKDFEYWKEKIFLEFIVKPKV